MSFIVKRRNVYHLHVRVPLNMIQMVGMPVLAVSLGTHNREHAKKLQRPTAARIHQTLRELKERQQQNVESSSKYLSPSDIRRLVRDYVKADMARFDLMQATGRMGDSGTVDDDLEALDVELDESRQALSMRRHVGCMGPHLSKDALGELLLRQSGWTPQEQEQEHALLCYEMLKARIRLKDRKKEKTETLTVTAVEFIRRFLLHSLPKRFVRIRHYGFLANRNRSANLAAIRQLMGLIDPIDKAAVTVESMMQALTGMDITACPCCKKGKMQLYREIPKGSARPPNPLAYTAA